MAVCIVVCMIVGYLFGCIQTGYIVGRVNKIDIRDYGSGNSGTTNTLRTLGKTAAIITFLGDAVKGLVAVNLARYVIMPAFHVEGEAYLWLLTGFAVVLGHNFPFYLGFKGGKGIATSLGVLLMSNWQIGLICLVFALVLMVLTKMVSVGSCGAAVLFPVLTLFINENYTVLTEGKSGKVYFVYSVILAIIVLYNHRANIKRIMSGTENKLSFGKKETK